MSVWWRPDCLAGVVGFELRNVGANYPFEKYAQIPGIQPNSGHRDYSRFELRRGDTQLGPSARDLGRRAVRFALRRARVAGPVGPVGIDVERPRGTG
jgi:hypothetical protein